MHAITRNNGIKVDVIKSGIVKYNVCDKPAQGKVLNKQYLIHWQNAKRLNLDFPLMRPEERYLGIAVVFHSYKISIQENSEFIIETLCDGHAIIKLIGRIRRARETPRKRNSVER